MQDVEKPRPPGLFDSEATNRVPCTAGWLRTLSPDTSAHCILVRLKRQVSLIRESVK